MCLFFVLKMFSYSMFKWDSGKNIRLEVGWLFVYVCLRERERSVSYSVVFVFRDFRLLSGLYLVFCIDLSDLC